MFSITIKQKLFINFILLLVIIGSYITYEVSFAKIAQDNFTDYRNTARSSVMLKKIESNLLIMEVNVKEFIKNFDTSYVESLYIGHENIVKNLEQIKTLSGAIKPYMSKISKFEELLGVYMQNFESVVELVKQRNLLVESDLYTTEKKISKIFKKTIAKLKHKGEFKNQQSVSEMMKQFYLIRVYNTRFLLDNDNESYVLLSKELSSLTKKINDTKQTKDLKEMLSLYKDTTENIYFIITKRNSIIKNNLVVLENEMNGLIKILSKNIISQQDTLGPQIVEQNDLSLQGTMIFSVVVIFLFIVVSLFFIWDFFKKISIFQSGLFDFFDFLKNSDLKPKPIKVLGNDEIAKMAKVVNESIDATTKIILQRDLANRINLEILNAQASIVLLTNGEKIVKANRTFLDFCEFESIEEFGKNYDCICDFFEYEEGKNYIQKEIDGLSWADYIASHEHEYHKVKMKEKVFHVNVTKFKLLDIEKYVVVFDDITKEIEVQKKLKENLEQIELLNKKLKEQAILDPLTKIFNRRGLQEHFSDVFESSKRKGLPISLIIFDIDFFKKVNDTYGHDKGDEVLVDMSNTLKKINRQSDLFGRFGGEEFIVIMPECDSDEALNGANRLRKYIEEHSGDISITISCGVYTTIATHEDSDKELFESMLKKADTALYEAKHTGRNKVVVSK